MNSLLFWKNRPPDFINDKGVKWWMDHDTMKYVRLPDKYQIFVVQDRASLTRVIVDSDKHEIIYEAQQLEALGCFCDMLRLMEEKE